MPGIDSNTKLLLRPYVDGVKDGSKEILDSAGRHIVTQVATASLSTAQKKFGKTSCFFDGNSDYLTLPDSSDWDIFANTIDDWTIDFWVYLNSTGEQHLAGQYEDSSNFWILQKTNAGGVRILVKTAGSLVITTPTTSTFSTGQWHHLAFVKVGDEYGIYVDGTQESYLQDTSTDTFSSTLRIGDGEIGKQVDGYIDDFRIQKSNVFNSNPISGLTDTITVPSSAHISDVNTKLLLSMESQDVSRLADNTPKIPTFIGTCEVDTAQYNFQDASYFFDGNSDYITIPDSSDWDLFGTTSETWTIDLWVYMDAAASSADVLGQLEGSPGDDCWWDLYVVDFSGYKRFYFKQTDSVYGQQVNLVPTAQLTEDAWHHISVICVNGVFGMYFDGTQVAYDSGISNAVTYTSSLLIGSGIQAVRYFDGYLDEIRIQKSNYFNATPVSGLTDTITVPTERYTYVNGVYIPAQTLIIV